jgi:hypothetical protein
MSSGGKKGRRVGGVPEWLASKKALKEMSKDYF